MFADLRTHQARLLSDRTQCTSDGADGLVLLLNHHLPNESHYRAAERWEQSDLLLLPCPLCLVVFIYWLMGRRR